jgi:hypothetical protein
MVIEKWVESFDSKRVNNFFYADSQKKDPILVQDIQL